MRPVFLLLLASVWLSAQAPPQLPPPGIDIPAESRSDLSRKLGALDQAIAAVAHHPLIADVLVLRDAVRTALDYNEFYKLDEPAKAMRLLEMGLERARHLAAGRAPWTTATGLVVRGYVSKIDGSVQPYGLVIPHNWRGPSRLDLWFHGRGNTLSEVNFITERITRPGEFTPPGAIVLHLYGRYCNATKFAGEVDVLEAMEHVKARYHIDEDRVFARGFSMGGASTWHIAAHFAGLFAAAAPGAGFAETREYANLAAKNDVRPWYEQKLWRWYDVTEYAANFFNLPLVAYSGELDRQMQAATIMDRYLREEGMQLAHVIGPKTEHRYHPDSKVEIEKRLAAIERQGRDAYPAEIRFTTYTLRYPQLRWIRVEGMEEHWEKARVNARVGEGEITLETSNVNAVRIDFGAGGWKQASAKGVKVKIDGQEAGQIAPLTDRSLTGNFIKQAGRWQVGMPAAGLRKKPGLQGPIDDAFLSSFIMVLPSKKGFDAKSEAWVKAESERAIARWRGLFRGAARVKKDIEITEADIAQSNLVLWGDPSSNSLLAKVVGQLPLQWNAAGVKLGQESCTNCVAVMVYPNPLNPERYVLLNSGPTMREDSDTTNSQQTPRLPDYALVGLDEPPGPVRPGRIVSAGFFDERWAWKARR